MSALASWSISYNMRSEISDDTRTTLGIDNDELIHNEDTFDRQAEDNKVEENVLAVLK